MAIIDITTIAGDTSDIQPAAGWRRINQDLNQGAGGKFIYLCVQEAYLGHPGPFVTDIAFVVGESAGVAAPAGFTRLPQDLNQGAGGKFIYLCYRLGQGREAADSPAVIQDIQVASFDSKLPYSDNPRYTMIPQDLNEGAGGRYLYLHTARNVANWMEKIAPAIQDRPLRRIAIPGTHDSATYSLTPDSEISPDAPGAAWNLRSLSTTRGVVYKWALAQNFTITQQLEAGVRFLDVRVMQRGDDPTRIHVVRSQWGVVVERVLEQIDDFLDKHPKEIVFLSLGTNKKDSLSTAAKLRLINDLVRARFEKIMIPPSVSTSVTPAQLWASGRRLLVLVNNQIFGDMSGERDWVWNYDEYAGLPGWVLGSDLGAGGTTSLQVLKGSLDRLLRRVYDSDRFSMLGCCLTPTEAMIEAGLVTEAGKTLGQRGGPTSLHEGCASLATPAAARWLREWEAESVNLLTTDFFQMSQTVDLCIARNLRPRRHYLRTALNGYVLDVPGGNAKAGVRPIMYPRNAPQSANQQWILDPSGHIRSALDPSLVLDVEGDRKEPGTPVILWTEKVPAAPNQRWDVDRGSGHIRSRLDPNLVLDIEGGSREAGAKLIVWPQARPDSNNQIFGATEV
jgi:hypothetical protein